MPTSPSPEALSRADAFLADCVGEESVQILPDTVRVASLGDTKSEVASVAFARVGQQVCPQCLTKLQVGYDDDGMSLQCSQCDWALSGFFDGLMGHEHRRDAEKRYRQLRRVRFISLVVLSLFVVATAWALISRRPVASPAVATPDSGPVVEHITLVPLKTSR